MTDTAPLIIQLRILTQLTRTEAQVARLRTAQARTDDVRRELAQNAQNADARSRRITAALRDLGAFPDPLTPALGRLIALLKGVVEQTQPLDEVLLADLALEHQLRDRARYLGALADATGRPSVRELADDLVTAHTATVDWLTDVLAEVATGGPGNLEASPLQRVAGQVTRAVNAPGRPAADEVGRAVSESVDRAVGTVTDAVTRAGEARAAVEDYAGRVARAGGGAARDAVTAGHDALATGRDAAVQAAGTVVRRVRPTSDDGDIGALTAADETTTPGVDMTATAIDPASPVPAESTVAVTDDGPDADRLPLPGFATMNAQAAIAAVRVLNDPDDVAVVVAFEQAHRNRSGVLAAARARAIALGSG
jgi:hypothetical protein